MAVWGNPDISMHVMGSWPGQLSLGTSSHNEQWQINREKIAFASLTQSPHESQGSICHKKSLPLARMDQLGSYEGKQKLSKSCVLYLFKFRPVNACDAGDRFMEREIKC